MDLEHLVGPAAGVGASVGWLLTSIFFTAAGKRVGPTAVNGVRLIFAVALLATTYRLFHGAWLPEATPRQLVFLALSGLVGLAIGDQLLFTAFVDIGPRLSLLIMTTSPIFAAAFGVLALDERLGAMAMAGIVVTLGGVAWVISERSHTRADDRPHPHRRRGVLFAFGGAACQAGGALLSKQGMGHGYLPEESHMDPLGATLWRMSFALVMLLPIVWAHWRWRAGRVRAGRATAPTRSGTKFGGLGFIILGAATGPYFGVWMSLVAYDRADLGVAQTLCSLHPVLILPLAVVLYKERITARAVIGAVVAVLGTVLLFLVENGSADGVVDVGEDRQLLVEPGLLDDVER